MVRNLRNHTRKLLLLAFFANAGLLIYLFNGSTAEWASISWTDIAGEGGSALLMLVWFVMLLKSRPPGRVTDLLALGLGCIFFSMWLDVLDEVIKQHDYAYWDNWLESVPMLLGLSVTTLGLYHWHHEQLAINAQMQKRELLFREHRWFDKITPLSKAEYFRRQLHWSLEQAQAEQQPLSLVALDLESFNTINERYGHAEGDHLLVAVSQLLLLNLRSHDLLCRLAGERFVVLLPNTGESQARLIADELSVAIKHLAHRTQQHGERLRLQANVSVVMALQEDADTLLERLNKTLAHYITPAPPFGMKA